MVALVKTVVKLFRHLIHNYWVKPLENYLRTRRLDSNKGIAILLRTVIWLKDLGWFLMTLGRVNVKAFIGKEWRVIFIQEDYTHSEEELPHMLFPERPHVSLIDRTFIWKIPRMLPRLMRESDLVLCDINRVVRWKPKDAKHIFNVPPWILMELEIDKSLDAIMAGMTGKRRWELRKLEKAGFTYEFSRNPSDLELFYFDMYVPYIRSRFNERAIIGTFESKQSMFVDGGLVMVKYQGQSVAGLLGHVTGDTFNIGSIGVHRDHFDLVKKGAILALNWFAVQWARDEGLRYVNIGMTRARVFDGVFEAKRHWGVRVRRHTLDHTKWMFLVNTIGPQFGNYLNEAGFIAEEKGSYHCVVMKNEVFGPSDEELERVAKIVKQAGLSGVHCYVTSQIF